MTVFGTPKRSRSWAGLVLALALAATATSCRSATSLEAKLAKDPPTHIPTVIYRQAWTQSEADGPRFHYARETPDTGPIDVAPGRIAVGPDGEVYVVDYKSGRVLRVSPDGRVSVFSETPAIGYDGLGVDDQGSVYMLRNSHEESRLYKFDRSGKMVFSFPPDGQPQLLTVHPTGRFDVGTQINWKESGFFWLTFGADGKPAGRIKSPGVGEPSALYDDRNGHQFVFVTLDRTWRMQLQLVTPKGNRPVLEYGRMQGVCRQEPLGFDKAGKLFVYSQVRGTAGDFRGFVTVYDWAARTYQVVDLGREQALGPLYLNVAIDPKGNIYHLQMTTSRMEIIRYTPGAVAGWQGSSAPPTVSVLGPAFASGLDGGQSPSIAPYTATTLYEQQWADAGAAPELFQHLEEISETLRPYTGPSAITVDSRGDIYVAEPVASRVQKLDPDGKVSILAEFKDSTVTEVGVDGSGFVYVLDTGPTPEVHKLDTEGKVVGTRQLPGGMLSRLIVQPSGRFDVVRFDPATAKSEVLHFSTNWGLLGTEGLRSGGEIIYEDGRGNEYRLDRLDNQTVRVNLVEPFGPLAVLDFDRSENDWANETIGFDGAGRLYRLLNIRAAGEQWGHLYVQVIDLKRLATFVVDLGSAQGLSANPATVTIDDRGNIYHLAVGPEGMRIIKYEPDGSR